MGVFSIGMIFKAKGLRVSRESVQIVKIRDLHGHSWGILVLNTV